MNKKIVLEELEKSFRGIDKEMRRLYRCISFFRSEVNKMKTTHKKSSANVKEELR